MRSSHVWRVLSEAPKLISWLQYQAPRQAGSRCRHHFVFLILVGFVLLLLPSLLFAESPEYRVVPIPAQLEYGRLNDSDVVVGRVWSQGSWMWNKGLITILPGLGSGGRWVTDINNDKVVIGAVSDSNGWHACVWQNGMLSTFDAPGYLVTWASSINSVGTVVGQAYDTTDTAWPIYPFIFTGSMTTLDNLENYEFNSINDGGVIAGTSWSTKNKESGRAFIYDGGTVTFLSAPGTHAEAFAINNSNHVLSEVNHLDFYLWKNGTQVFLESLTNFGGLNDHDLVVGYLSSLGAVIWENGELRQLDALIDPNLGLHLANAFDINNKGRILCKGSNNMAYLLMPIRAITVRDANNDTIPNVEFNLIKVTNDPPFFTEDTLGFFTTDSVGQLNLKELVADTFEVNLSTGTKRLVNGDSLKIAKHVHSVPAVRHPGIVGTMYSVHLDNVQFDKDGSMSFGTLKRGRLEAVLNHTELRYNLLVSVEWDAGEAYQEGLQADFRQMSNYLYDVTDGQLRLDTVGIVDDGELWDIADVRIRASNIHNPDAVPNAIGHGNWYPINMPRKWYGNEEDCRGYSYENHPLNAAVSEDYRAKAHEFGHYGLAFYDEYLFCNQAGECSDVPDLHCQPLPAGNYGFMDFEYEGDEGGVRSSEMSSRYRYVADACRNTQQIIKNDTSCWDQFEEWAEGTFDGIYVPIRRPDQADTLEHLTPAGLDYIRGPNDNLAVPDYDVGENIYFASSIQPPDPANRSLNIYVDGVPAGGVDVTLKKNLTGGGERVIEQGKTRDDGLIWVLGGSGADNIQTYGHNYIIINQRLATSVAEVSRQWLTGSLDVSTMVGDSGSITLHPIDGEYPMVLTADIAIAPQRWRLEFAQPFSQLPTLGFLSGSGQPMSPTVTQLTDNYNARPDDTIASEGQARLDAVDGVGNSFFVPFSYIRYDITDSTQLEKLLGPGAHAILSLSSSNSTITKALLAASSYPPIMTGLESDAAQAGNAYATSVSPGVSLIGANNLTILYNDNDLKAGDSAIGDESLLKMYRWHEGLNNWQYIGGLVDTSRNEVTASITELGTYVVFTTKSPVGVEDESDDNLPYRFKLSQNYPNPFNPVTTIEYSVPSRTDVTIEIFNVLGQKVRTLANETKSAGSYRIEWNGNDESGRPVSTGVYLYRFQAGDVVQTKKMLLLK